MPVDNALQIAVRDGVALSYLDTGVGAPPLLFIHGWCCDHTYWREQILAFQDRHWTIAIDLRGHGASDKPAQDYTIAGFTQDLAWLCREISIDKPIIVGHSMGGVIGLNLVRTHPDLARGLVMVDSPVLPVPEPLRPTVESVLAGLRSPAYKDVAVSFISSMMFGPQSPQPLKDRIIAGMTEAPQRLMSTALTDLLSDGVKPPGPIGVPSLYVLAATSPWDPDTIKARYPGVQLQRMATGHFAQMEAPDKFNQILRQFIEAVL